MATFIHNKSHANVSLLDGRILIAVGGKSRPITDQEAEHEDVIHAKRSGWITIEGEKSETSAPAPAAEIVMTKDPMKGSATIPEAAPKKEAAVSTPIGTPGAEVEETGTEAKPKKAKKEKAAE